MRIRFDVVYIFVHRCRYKKALYSGVKNACLHVAETLDYPPSLIAKIVVTNYLAEMRTKKFDHSKTTSTPQELKRMRRRQCGYCKSAASLDRSNLSAFDSDVDTDRPTTSHLKKHDDPRIELALNLFDDEDDSVGKYLLDKFTFSQNNIKSKEQFNRLKLHETNRSNKFFWEASSFEEMGEKNVKRRSNVERLFSRMTVDEQPADHNRSSTEIIDNCDSLKCDVKNSSFGIETRVEESYGTDDVSDISFDSTSNHDSTVNSSFSNPDVKKVDARMCYCILNSESEGSDTDSMDSDETCR